MSKKYLWIFLFNIFPLQGWSFCIAPNTCYYVTGNIFSCERKTDEFGNTYLIVEVVNQIAEECPVQQQNVNDRKSESEYESSKDNNFSSFIIYPRDWENCTNLPKKITKAQVMEDCCDTVPATGACSEELDILIINKN